MRHNSFLQTKSVYVQIQEDTQQRHDKEKKELETLYQKNIRQKEARLNEMETTNKVTFSVLLPHYSEKQEAHCRVDKFLTKMAQHAAEIPGGIDLFVVATLSATVWSQAEVYIGTTASVGKRVFRH